MCDGQRTTDKEGDRDIEAAQTPECRPLARGAFACPAQLQSPLLIS